MGRDHGLELPEEFEELNRLTPFAVEYRYEFYAEEVEPPLDRQRVLEQVRRLRAWVEARLAEIEGAKD